MGANGRQNPQIHTHLFQIIAVLPSPFAYCVLIIRLLLTLKEMNESISSLDLPVQMNGFSLSSNSSLF